MLRGLQQAQQYSNMLGFKSKTKEYEMIDPKDLIEIECQPFKPYPKEKLEILAEDIQLRGQDVPCKVRRMANGELIVLAGRNRKRACELKSLKVKCEIKEYTDDEAQLVLVNTNLLQRQELLISEKVRAYAIQKKAYEKLNITLKTLSNDTGECVANIKRYIRLDMLDNEYLEMIDNNQIQMMAGYELTFISKLNRDVVKEFIKLNSYKLNKNKAKFIKDLEKEYPIFDVLLLQKTLLAHGEPQQKTINFTSSEITNLIPKGVNPKEYILELLEKAHRELVKE